MRPQDKKGTDMAEEEKAIESTASQEKKEVVYTKHLLLYAGLRVWTDQSIRHSWRHKSVEGWSTTQYEYSKLQEIQRPVVGSIYEVSFTAEDRYVPSRSKNGPVFIDFVGGELLNELVLTHRANETVLLQRKRAEKQKREASDIGRLSLEEFKKVYKKTNYVTKRAMLAELLEYIERE